MFNDGVLPPGLEWCSDTELVSMGLLNGLVFGLGWCRGPRFGIDIGRANKYTLFHLI